MQHKKLLVLVFILVALIQIYVPAKMVYDSEVVLDEGTAFKFKTAPVDPNDPFRGKYITLQFDIDEYEVDHSDDWERGEDIYVSLTTDRDGYAKISNVTKTTPYGDIDYVKAQVRYAYARRYSPDTTHMLYINYSFNRFYMEESKAYDAEVAYRESRRDTSQTVYAIIHVKEGEPIIKDVMIDEMPIREYVMNEQNK